VNFDFSALLVLLTAVSGAIWAFDVWVTAPRRRRRAAAAGSAETPAEPLLVEYARSFFPVFLIVLLLRSFLVEPFRIPSGSMMPTLRIGDFVLVNKYDYGIRLPVLNLKVIENDAPARGDIIVFRYPEDPSVPYIKRVIGVPGDRIEYRDKVLYVNGAEAPQAIPDEGAGPDPAGNLEFHERLGGVEHAILVDPRRPDRDYSVTVPENGYFVLGDNRDNSRDSRFWGFVPDEHLIGRAFLIWMNWNWKNGGIDWKRIGTILS
jgi:signal peptidase I